MMIMIVINMKDIIFMDICILVYTCTNIYTCTNKAQVYQLKSNAIALCLEMEVRFGFCIATEIGVSCARCVTGTPSLAQLLFLRIIKMST